MSISRTVTSSPIAGHRVKLLHWDQISRWRRATPHRSSKSVHLSTSSLNCGLIQSIMMKTGEWCQQREPNIESDDAMTPITIPRGYSSVGVSPFIRSPTKYRIRKTETLTTKGFELTRAETEIQRSSLLAKQAQLALTLAKQTSAAPKFYSPNSQQLAQLKGQRRLGIIKRPSSMKASISKSLEGLVWGQAIPRHFFSELLLQGLGDKTLIYCEVPVLKEKEFIDKIAGVLDLKRDTLEIQKKKKEIGESWKLNLDIYERENLPTQPQRTKFLTKQQIAKSIETYFGKGEKRVLRPGEQALIEKQLEFYLKKVLKQPELLLNNANSIVKTILNETNLYMLGGYPLCAKQIVAMWKIRLTKELFNMDKEGPAVTPEKKKIYRIVPHAVSRGHLLVTAVGPAKKKQYAQYG